MNRFGARWVAPVVAVMALAVVAAPHAEARATKTARSQVAAETRQDTLGKDQQLNVNQQLESANGQYRLTLQSDGNAVIYTRSGRALWASGTRGSGAVRLRMQGDGNLVMRDARGRAVWSSKTAGKGGVRLVMQDDGNLVMRDAGGRAVWASDTAQPVADETTLKVNGRLDVNGALVSPNGRYRLVLQGDGNLVLYDSAGKALWATGTVGSGAYRLYLQGDGNLVLRDRSGRAVWSSQTHGKSVVALALDNAGNLSLKGPSGETVWTPGMTPVSPDRVRPVIVLKGAANDMISQGQPWRDPGVTATDDRDGDITDRVRVSGQVNTAVPGTYRLSYSVSDSAGNAAEPVTRVVVVTEAAGGSGGNGDSDGSGGGGIGPVDTQPLGRFTAPHAPLYDLNDARPRTFPVVIDTGFEGNGHAETWDGRLFVRTRTQGWFVSTFRPERIVRRSDGTPDFRQGAFGRSVLLEDRNVAKDMQINWLAIVPDPDVRGENPYPSDRNGNYREDGRWRTYKALVYHTSKRNGDNDQMGLRKATFIVSDPYTPDAEVVSARFTTDFRKFTLTDGRDFRCIEPSATVDGRLIICQGHPANNGRIDNLVYSWNPTSGALNGWRPPKSIANLYWDERDVSVAGIPFSERYPIAQQPLRDADGQVYQRNELVKGAYPWISRDGSELFFQASREGMTARRTGTTVVGRWTGWLFRHIDGPINPNRHRRSRLFLSSPGAFTTMWSPFKDVDDLKIPYSVRGPAYPIFGSNTHDYSEVGFEDYLDGNFVFYLAMNEQLDRAGNFLKTRTADTSGHFNNAILKGARFPLEYNGRDELVGRLGQAIYFSPNTWLEVERRAGWENIDRGLTFDTWVKVLNARGEVRLFALGQGVEVSLTGSRALTASLTDRNGRRVSLSGGQVPQGTWAHVAATFETRSGDVRLYVNGREVARREATGLGTPDTRGAVRVGPEQSDALLLLDEVKLSDVARTPAEVAWFAYVPTHKAASPALLGLIPEHLRSERFHASGIDRFSTAAAELGEQLFSDTILSRHRTTSCATCHDPRRAFTDGLPLARGNEPTDMGIRNAPALINRLFSSTQGWSGMADSLDVQALIPIQAPHEMNLPIEAAVDRLKADPVWLNRFRQVYGEPPSARNIAAALASFQAIQFAPRTRVDAWRGGDRSALTPSEQRGLQLFEGKARCSGCHAGNNYTDESYRNNGLTRDRDPGRAEVTGRDRDHRLFKVPTLRQLVHTAPYMHDGSFATLRDVVEAYNRGAPDVKEKDTDIRPLELSETEITDLVNFLKALSD